MPVVGVGTGVVIVGIVVRIVIVGIVLVALVVVEFVDDVVVVVVATSECMDVGMSVGSRM